MKKHSTLHWFAFLLIALLIAPSCQTNHSDNWQWELLEANGNPTPRHEAGLVAFSGKLYLIGGRRINPTSEYDPQTNSWTEKAATPIELHHFQPVVLGDAIYIVGAMTGEWPNETPVDRIVIYYPERDEFVYGDTIPAHRRRGGAGAAVYNGKIYLVGGITNGHMNGFQSWLDEYDPKTGKWKALKDAPNARDHFQAVVVQDKLYAFAGRTTSKISDQDINLTVGHGNVYNLLKGEWETVLEATQIPTERAGNFAFVWNESVVIGGGETLLQEAAHSEVEAYDVARKLWRKWPSMKHGRHGTGFAVVGDYVYTASGCGKHGGEPELGSIERLALPKANPSPMVEVPDSTPVHMQWHTVTRSFKGPVTSENDANNPYLNYRLSVEFKHAETQQIVRGFYAADGNAAETSAQSGNVWQVRFKPNKTGSWTYSATLHAGENIALSEDLNQGTLVSIPNPEGSFIVMPSDKEGEDFRAKGRLGLESGYFKFRDTELYWLKAGTDSPENLLGYVDFDDTYRTKAEARFGEAAAPETIHRFTPHVKDWRTGDPSWKDGKGKALIGGLNYLASKGMNSAYFLTLNITGDGKDVWPYVAPDDFTRFDVSKLDQWEIVFEYMQSKGMLLHVVLQETENETMLDSGDTGPLRQLYFRELIARFGHHLALVWNLGEENGPAPWTPIGQNDAQRKAMTQFLKATDPYQHPVVLHTHADDPVRENILNDMLSDPNLDGLSFQEAEREQVSALVQKWKQKSKASGREWLITMDEIGMWHTGALPDSLDPDHPTLQHYVLWGSLLSGAAGVEWYFGAHHPHNDLTSEDWRQRNRLWEITNHAKVFFNEYLPYWEMQPQHDLVNAKGAYCFRKRNEIYALYFPKNGRNTSLDLSEAHGSFEVFWYDPLTGGDLQQGSVKTISGGGIQSLGLPDQSNKPNKDWVILVKKQVE